MIDKNSHFNSIYTHTRSNTSSADILHIDHNNVAYLTSKFHQYNWI